MHDENSAQPVVVRGPSAGVRTLEMNQPSTRNALTSSLVDGLHAALAEAKSDAETRCVVLTSAHPHVFCAGGDLNTFTAGTPLVERHRGMDRVAGLFSAIEHLGKPVIAAVGGHALAGGMGLVLACDLVLASEDAQFGCPEITIGTFPFMVSAMLARAVGKFKASEILMTGANLTAHEAQDSGLVNAVFSSQEFVGAVTDWANRLAERSPLILGMGKDALIASRDMSMPDALAFLQTQLSLAFSTRDLNEGVTAFFERRQPVWEGR